MSAVSLPKALPFAPIAERVCVENLQWLPGVWFTSRVGGRAVFPSEAHVSFELRHGSIASRLFLVAMAERASKARSLMAERAVICRQLRSLLDRQGYADWAIVGIKDHAAGIYSPYLPVDETTLPKTAESWQVSATDLIPPWVMDGAREGRLRYDYSNAREPSLKIPTLRIIVNASQQQASEGDTLQLDGRGQYTVHHRVADDSLIGN